MGGDHSPQSDKSGIQSAWLQWWSGNGKTKIPTIKHLNQEYAQVLSGKKKAYTEYREARKQMQDYLIAQKNVGMILGVEQEQEEKRRQQEQQKKGLS